ncbi:GNAT family N-acetyltransferase [Nonomuraea sp. SMC257]|uniref:GNAT family N-acetyltransferase n=1 Tax=Nonomuraea montanisoli TaxID=2741721 RepID=A0A7Y6I815_9ACTN|nr:GNAT family N-acetyltransferase [Nonomuraea montanisoli]NUW33236.1 GNAT family N-acetyltransferase [Nonomuraea montanisoli]
MLKPDYPLATPRLDLRPFTPDDLDAVHAFESRPDVTRYLYWDARDLDAARAGIDTKMGRTAIAAEGDSLNLAVVRRDTGHLIGLAMLVWTSEQHRQGEIGYVFNPDHHGHGFATEASREMLRLGFEALGLHRICGRLDGRNTASARVLERLGMRREAHLIQNEYVKGEWTDEVIYAMLAGEWTA